MRSIGSVRCICKKCGWWGTVSETEPDVDGDGGLGCPQCLAVIEAGIPQNDKRESTFNQLDIN